MSGDLALRVELPVECSDDDGIVLDVGGEIFRVAHCRLVKASPILRDMFSLGRSGEEGTDAQPFVLVEVESIAFRDFLWAIFVRPGELTKFLRGPNTAEKAVKLVNIAKLSHKFQDFPTLEWAMQQLHETLPTVYLGEPLLVQLFIVLALFDAESAERLNVISDLRDALRKQLAFADEHKSAVAEIASHFIDPIALVKASAESGFTAVRADAYYHLLLLPHELWATPNSGLSETDRQRMLSSAFLLVQEWSQLRGQMLPNTYALPSLDSQIATKRPTDLLAKLKAFLDFLSSGARSHADGVLRRDVEERISTFTDRLPQYFNDSLFAGV